MFWTVVIVSVGLAVVFKVFMLRKFSQWMTADRLARLAEGHAGRLGALRALHDRLKAEGIKSEARWAHIEAAAQDLSAEAAPKAAPDAQPPGQPARAASPAT